MNVIFSSFSFLEPCLDDLAEKFEDGELDCASKCPAPCRYKSNS